MPSEHLGASHVGEQLTDSGRTPQQVARRGTPGAPSDLEAARAPAGPENPAEIWEGTKASESSRWGNGAVGQVPREGSIERQGRLNLSHGIPRLRVWSRGQDEVMALKLSDLPPAARERALRAAGEPPERRKASRKGTGDAQPCDGSCSGCGETFDRYTRWERHHDAGCVGRWVIGL